MTGESNLVSQEANMFSASAGGFLSISVVLVPRRSPARLLLLCLSPAPSFRLTKTLFDIVSIQAGPYT